MIYLPISLGPSGRPPKHVSGTMTRPYQCICTQGKPRATRNSHHSLPSGTDFSFRLNIFNTQIIWTKATDRTQSTVLVSTVVSRAGVPLAVLVGHDGSHRLHHWHRGEVLRRDELQTLHQTDCHNSAMRRWTKHWTIHALFFLVVAGYLPLAGLLVLDDVGDLGIHLLQRRVQLLRPLHPTHKQNKKKKEWTNHRHQRATEHIIKRERERARTVTPDLSSVAGRDACESARTQTNPWNGLSTISQEGNDINKKKIKKKWRKKSGTM